MKIAFISYEYPPDTAIGGIATYVYQIAKLLQERGHHIEVFAASSNRTGTAIEDGIVVHRIQEKMGFAFAERIGAVFAERHCTIQFDVLEGPEAAACASGAVKRVPDIPLVVKLHTPGFIIGRLNDEAPSLPTKLRWYFGAIRRAQIPKPYPRIVYDPKHDLERLHTLDADEITTPCIALGQEMIQEWGLDTDKIVHIPNPYIPSQSLLDIPIPTSTNVVGFLGRLEIRKGILELGRAIPLIVRQFPQVKFRFVGAPCPSPQPGVDMRQYLEKTLRRFKHQMEFVGPVPPEQVPLVLAQTDICVFPSRWENFPNVCLEAMAAGRGIVGSSAGGMAEMLDAERSGRLVPPYCPEKIAEAVIELLNNPVLRMQLGETARDRVLAEYNLERIGALQEASYARAIQRRQALGTRQQIPAVR